MSGNGEILKRETERVLVIMTDHHMGNFVISLPVIGALAGYFQNGVDVLVDERYATLAGLLPGVNRVIEYPAQGRKRRGILMNLRPMAVMLGLMRKRYRAVLDVGGGTRAALCSVMTLARRRVGFKETPNSWLYWRRISRSGVVHVLDQYARILECVGMRGRPGLVRLRAPESAREALEEKLRKEQIDARARIAIIHPGAGKEYRQWPLERFATVADHMVERHGMKVCIIGATSDRALMEGIRGAMRNPDSAFSMVLPMDELLALCERSAILLSNESGPTHLAATTELPIATIFGPSKEEIWRPIRDANTMVLRGDACDPRCGKRRCFADRRCLMALEPRQMIDAAETLLGRVKSTSLIQSRS